jgi:hypothetical protein
MAHFAKLDESNNVIDIVVVFDHDTADENGVEQEAIGKAFLENSLGGRWIQCSYSGRIRKQHPGVGYTYNEEGDVFVRPKPYVQWVLDENYDWQAPVPKPDEVEGYHWHWNEEGDGAWESHENIPAEPLE